MMSRNISAPISVYALNSFGFKDETQEVVTLYVPILNGRMKLLASTCPASVKPNNNDWYYSVTLKKGGTSFDLIALQISAPGLEVSDFLRIDWTESTPVGIDRVFVPTIVGRMPRIRAKRYIEVEYGGLTFTTDPTLCGQRGHCLVSGNNIALFVLGVINETDLEKSASVFTPLHKQD